MSGTRRPVRRALISVFDKSGVVDLAAALSRAGAEILSTGGTARALLEARIPVREVSDLTGFPELLDGRLKTLHPRVHGGLLAVRDNAVHQSQAREHGIEMIDLVAINLYPFESTLRERPGDAPAIVEMIDIGGPAMIRSAAKNHADVTVLVDPRDYGTVLREVESGGTTLPTRAALAARAFAHTAAYDAVIAGWMQQRAAPRGEEAGFPDLLALGFRKARDLRYGENPHQRAALYLDPLEQIASAATSRQLQGKEISFNNLLDLDAAWGLVCDFSRPACAIIKHTNPAGAALGDGPADAYRRALACDPVSAFGGIVAFNRAVTAEAARDMEKLFLEAVIAPDYEPAALEALASRRNLRVMQAGDSRPIQSGRDYRRIVSGLLVQDRDLLASTPGELKVVTRRAPTPQETESLQFAWTVARHVRSNAIVFARACATTGIGAGQMSRVDAVRFGALKAVEPLAGSVLASDAFFPFRDGVDAAAGSGVTAIIQPGGSVRDSEVIAAADERGIAMVFTGRRHFRH